MDAAQKIAKAEIPQDLKEKLNNSLKFSKGEELEKVISYIDFVISLPFNKSSQDILDLHRAKEILDKNHYGLQSVKDRILEYLSVLTLQSKKGGLTHAPILLFVGLVGTGKTSLAYSIAESLGRKIFRIPFGGLGDVSQIRGTSRLKAEGESGQIIKALSACGVNNPVILLDEIDRVAEEARVDIMGTLVELLDPAQNQAFLDHFLDYPFDLSKVLFISTANNVTNLATAVVDRLEIVQMPSYSDDEKMVIGKNYLLPKALADAGIDFGLVIISDDSWPQIIRPLGYDSGIRSLQRTLQTIARKIARKVVEGLPAGRQGANGQFQITTQNLGEYLSL